MNNNTPVIIGIGQYSEQAKNAKYAALSPMDLAGKSLQKAISDCNASGDVTGALDTIAAIRQFENSTPVAQAPFGKSDNPPRSIANRVGADPTHAILEYVGGQGPQKLVGELAANIAAGQSQCAAIVGSEAISTMLHLLKSGEQADWSEEIGGQLEDRGYGMSGMVDKAIISNGMGGPIQSYALFENARRAKLGLTPDQYRAQMGALFAPFTKVAAHNPHAAAPIARSAAELAEVTERNRIVAEPFPRMMVARDQVNQAAAIIIASTGKARELGIPEERWVHIHASVDAKEASVLERGDLATSPAAIASMQTALDIAGIAIEDADLIDFYSCFPIAVFNITDAFGIAPDDPRGLTLTGGLPFFGGAGNNYSAHAIAEAVMALRARSDDAYALIGANGGFMSKYSTGVYSRKPADWTASTSKVNAGGSSGARWTTLPAQAPTVTVQDEYSGSAVVESYTIMPGKGDESGSPSAAAVIARTPCGARIAAMAAPDDAPTLDALSAAEPIGRKITVTPADKGRNVFQFVD